MNKFSTFNELADSTLEKILSFGITSKTVIKYYKTCVKNLEELMNKSNTIFNKEIAFKWLNSPECIETLSEHRRMCFRRTILLLYDNLNNNLNEWKTYSKDNIMNKLSNAYLSILQDYKNYLHTCNYELSTIRFKVRCARDLLIYLETLNIYDIKKCTHQILSNYLLSNHFQNRKPTGINAEIQRIKHFIIYLQDNNYTDYKNLHYALYTLHIQERKIVSVLSKETEEALLSDFPNLATNLRDKAAYLLALRCGLRSCDIVNLKFSNINWNNKIITINQKKTGISLEIPIDNETLNAIIEYILKERKKCNLENIFVTTLAPIRPLSSTAFRKEIRSKTLPDNLQPAHNGLHIMRRTYASKLLNKGVEVSVIASALGHQDKKRIDKYLSTNEEKMKLCALEITDFPYKGGIFL